MPRTLKHVCLAICMAAWLVLLSAAPSPAIFGPDETDKEDVAVGLAREVQRGGYDLVTTEELKGWQEQSKDMVIVDTMPYDSSYAKNHIPGAVQFLFPKGGDMQSWNPEQTGGSKEAFLELLGQDRSKPVVIYCGFVECTRSHNGAMWAAKLGYEQVYRYAGGIKAWMDSGYAIDSLE